jgi:hypothetical protein
MSALPRLRANQVPVGRFHKRSPGRCCPRPATTLYHLRHANVIATVKRLTGATKWHEVQINLGCTAQACDGFLSPSQVPPQTEPEAPVHPPSPGLLLCEGLKLAMP